MKKNIVIVFVLILSGTIQLTAKNSSESINEKVEKVLKQLTLEEKVRLCHAQSKFSSSGVPRLGIPQINMSDGPHGVRAEIQWDSWDYAGWTNDSCTAFPALTCLASTFNPTLAYTYGKAIGEEARYRNKNVLLGPGVNIYRTPANGRNFEYMGEDPFLASVLVVPYIKGVQENGVAACVKHFALNNQETERDKINVELSDRALHEIYLPAFKAAVMEGHVWSVMCAYNKVRGQYCSENELLNNKILKGDWAFDGVIISDWGAVHSTKLAAINGMDIEMGTGSDGLTYSLKNVYDNYFLAYPFLKMLKSGEIDVKVVDDKARRILRLMYRTSMNESQSTGSMTSEKHFQVARDIAREGIVLLKNQKQLLPIDASRKQTIAVIGENATRSMTIGGGSSELKTKKEISPLAGIKQRFDQAIVLHAMGYSSGASTYGTVNATPFNQDSLRKEAIDVASKADVVVFVGGLNKSHLQDCENGDRESYDLPFNQNELISDILKVNKNVVIVLVSGNAVAMPWISEVSAVVQAWYLGSEAGSAIADILSGDINPSGKLPISYPKKLSDNGAISFGAISYPGIDSKQEYKDDILVGYRWYDTKKIQPLFEFGHGLSYTTFKIANAVLDKSTYGPDDSILLSVTVSNTGNCAGAEVIQVYAKDEKASVMRPEKELKGFQKIFLQPGESKKLEIKVPASSLAFYDDQSHNWKLEPGAFQFLVGTSSRAIKQKLGFTIKE